MKTKKARIRGREPAKRVSTRLTSKVMRGNMTIQKKRRAAMNMERWRVEMTAKGTEP